MKTSLLVTLLLFAAVLVVSAGASKPSFELTTDINGNPVFSFSNLNPSYDYDLTISAQNVNEGDHDIITPDADGKADDSFGALPADKYEVVLTEIHKNGNLAHNPAIDEMTDVP